MLNQKGNTVKIMKNIIILLVISLMPQLNAQSIEPETDKIHDELRALKSIMEKALNEKDIETIIKHVDDNVTFTTMNGDFVRGKEKVRAYFEKMMKGDERIVDSVESNFEADDLSVLHGEDLAISTGTANDSYKLKNGDDFKVQARWSSTMVRQDGQWKVANFHYSTNMFDNPILEAQRTVLIGLGIGGAVILGLIGFFIGRRKKQE